VATIGRYELMEPLGRGAHGTVYRALQEPLGREVALKLWSGEGLAPSGAFERWSREVKLLQRLEHPNIVRLFDFGTTESGVPYIVCELLRGRSLEQELARGPLSTARAGHVIAQLLKALMEAHALGVVHRDIKPANVILVDYAGEADFAKLLDFGIARASDPTLRTLTGAGQLVGTPSYMAPEQIRGGEIGPATDLYAVGLLLAELVTAEAVFAEGSPFELWAQQSAPGPVPFSAAVLASPFAAVIRRATAKPIAERFLSASDMLEAIELALASSHKVPLHGPLAEPEPPPRTERMPTTSSRIALHPPPAMLRHQAPATAGQVVVRALRREWRLVAAVALAVLASAGLATGLVLSAGRKPLVAPSIAATAPAKASPQAQLRQVGTLSAPPDGSLGRVDAACLRVRFAKLGWSVIQDSTYRNPRPGPITSFFIARTAGMDATAIVEVYDIEAEPKDFYVEGYAENIARIGGAVMIEGTHLVAVRDVKDGNPAQVLTQLVDGTM
jgi:serine/threonine-protein kinase